MEGAKKEPRRREDRQPDEDDCGVEDRRRGGHSEIADVIRRHAVPRIDRLRDREEDRELRDATEKEEARPLTVGEVDAHGQTSPSRRDNAFGAVRNPPTES